MTTCGCGCGALTALAPQSSTRDGWIKGQPRRFIQGHNDRTRSWPEDRFWAKVTRGAANDCWEWTGARGQFGHGKFYMDPPASIPAHRAALIFTGTDVPAGAIVCHHCDNPPCVNPAHLFVGTQLDNVRDMIAKGRSRAGEHQLQRTHCPQGHAYDESNTTRRRGQRHCRACGRERMRERRAAAREAIAAAQTELAWLDESTWGQG